MSLCSFQGVSHLTQFVLHYIVEKVMSRFKVPPHVFFSQLLHVILILSHSWCPYSLEMADNSNVAFGTAPSLLVDSSVYDSRIEETAKDYILLGMGGDDGEGQSALDNACIICLFVNSHSKKWKKRQLVFECKI